MTSDLSTTFKRFSQDTGIENELKFGRTFFCVECDLLMLKYGKIVCFFLEQNVNSLVCCSLTKNIEHQHSPELHASNF